MSSKKIDFDAINQAALGAFEGLLRQWLPDGKKNGAEYSSVNPTRNDAHPGSFTINIYKGVWKDFATGDSGNDPISLYAYLFHNNNQGSAAKELGDLLRISHGKAVKLSAVFKPVKTPVHQAAWIPIIPPADAPEPPKAHIKRGLPETVFCYRGEAGNALGYVYRFKNSTGGKETLPLSWSKHLQNGAEEWRWLSFAKPRFLYGLDRLGAKPKAPVLIVEGEKCADAATGQLPNMACVSWPGGGKAIDKADWSPLAGRDVVIWPDCDSLKDKVGDLFPHDQQPGWIAAVKIADLLGNLGCKVWIMDIDEPGVKVSGWDVADAIEEGLIGTDLAGYIRSKARLITQIASPPANDGQFHPLTSTLQLLERYSLIYGHGGTVFDHHDRIMLKQSDMVDACVNRDFAKQWQASSQRKIVRIDNVGFDPGFKDSNITCNLWSGWPTVPVPGSCAKLIKLIHYMCGGEESETAKELFYWVIRWLAYPIQHPGAKMKSTLVVHGPQGTGKNLVFECIMDIYGQYGRIIGQDAIEDRFNDWASKKLFLIADEVVARSDLYHVKNKLKSFITGDWIRINPKNLMAYEERNHVNLVFLSNERMPVVLEEDDRRHAVIWTPEKLTSDFYVAIANEKNNGGVAALHDYLLKVDLGDFNEHTPPPMTNAKKELIDLSKDTISRFYEEWEAGHIDGFTVMPVMSESFYELYKLWCGKQGVKPGSMLKLIDFMIKRLHCVKERARYKISPERQSIYPKTFLFPEAALMPEGLLQTDWLGKCVDAFQTNLMAYKESRSSYE